MGQGYFAFQHFTVHHDRCAMKVGTDGVLLGAWADLPQRGRILDVGTGSGLIALMAAQRCPECQVTGIDIDPLAVQQARENIAESPYRDRVEVLEQDLLTFAPQAPFDCVLCNPPFYVEDVLPPSEARMRARNTAALSFCNLIGCVEKILTQQGTFSVIIPTGAVDAFRAEALAHGLYLHRSCRVTTVLGKESKRTLLTFSKQVESAPSSEQLVLQEKDGTRSPAFSYLTRDFYLHR